jgi:thiazole/oxazole-forming peptide maturase SagD family component
LALLADAYSRESFNRVPSAGALFGLGISVVRPLMSPGLSAGTYTMAEDACSLTREGASPLPAQLGAACGDSVFASSFVTTLVISAFFGVPVAKYGNRGYRYALIEVGHVAQQIQRFCADNAISVFEYGGFFDQGISSLLALNGGLPVLVLGLGLPGGDVISDSDQWDRPPLPFPPDIVGSIRVLGPGPSRDLPLIRVGAVASSSSHDGLGRGCGASLAEAKQKATSEALERLACMALRVDQRSPAADLSMEWVDPRVAYPLKSHQYSRLGLAKFDERNDVNWIVGQRVSTSSPCLVPVDYVFFGESLPQENPLYRATTSGVACHRSLAEAGRAAVLELIERDAVMRAWLARAPLSRVPPGALDDYTRDRQHYWSARGELAVLYVPSEYAHCIIACLFLDRYPYFSCGAAAEIDLTRAAAHAVIEAECISMELREDGQRPARLGAGEVLHAFDHCRYYADRRRVRTIRWLRDLHSPARPPNRDEDDIWRVDPVLVELSDPHGPPIVRAIAESLVPINFGQGFVHRTHHRVATDVNRATVHMFG